MPRLKNFLTLALILSYQLLQADVTLLRELVADDLLEEAALEARRLPSAHSNQCDVAAQSRTLAVKLALRKGAAVAAQDPAIAFDQLHYAYLNAANPRDFSAAGLALHHLLRGQRSLRRRHHQTWLTLQSSLSEWSLPRAARTRRPAPAWQRWPSDLTLWFYRGQIAPAIGQRCVLHPSCSAYFAEACRQHGLLGFPILADRLFREPQASARSDRLITLPDGSHRIADPLSDHTQWLKP